MTRAPGRKRGVTTVNRQRFDTARDLVLSQHYRTAPRGCCDIARVPVRGGPAAGVFNTDQRIEFTTPALIERGRPRSFGTWFGLHDSHS